LKQRQKPFDYLWQEGFIEECLENYKIWTNLPGVLISQYEDVMQNLAGEVQRIAQHLCLKVSATRCQEIADLYDISLQKQRMEQFKQKLLQTTLDPDNHREIIDYHDEETLLHINHIDSAKAGRWQDDLSIAEVATIEQKVNDWCQANGYEPSTFLRESIPSNHQLNGDLQSENPRLNIV
jgi:hypothetical protein